MPSLSRHRRRPPCPGLPCPGPPCPWRPCRGGLLARGGRLHARGGLARGGGLVRGGLPLPVAAASLPVTPCPWRLGRPLPGGGGATWRGAARGGLLARGAAPCPWQRHPGRGSGPWLARGGLLARDGGLLALGRLGSLTAGRLVRPLAALVDAAACATCRPVSASLAAALARPFGVAPLSASVSETAAAKISLPVLLQGRRL
jgi:hypothetical protein